MSRKKKNTLLFRILALLLIVCTLTGSNVFADESIEPRASYYLSSYNSYPYNAAWGKVRIYFDVTGVNYMDEIGTLNIKIYESTDNSNFYWVKAFSFTNHPNMLWHDDYICIDHVDYEGVPGRYYKAYVQIWAGPEDGGDTRYIWTPVERCI